MGTAQPLNTQIDISTRHYNQLIFIGLQSSKNYYNRPVGVVEVHGKGHLGVSFLRGSMFAEGMGCERRWVRWVLRGTETASRHSGVR